MNQLWANLLLISRQSILLGHNSGHRPDHLSGTSAQEEL